MRLTFQAAHLSIDALEEVEINDFSVLTGVNGSGKSHLLDALTQKKISINGELRHKIVKFNFETFKLENEGAFNALQISSEREDAWNHFTAHIVPTLRAAKARIPDYDSLARLCSGERKSMWERAGDQYRNEVQNFFAENPHVKGHHSAVGVLRLLQTLPYSIDDIKRETFYSLYKPYLAINDFLPHALGKVFWDYYVKYRSNQVNEFQRAKHGKSYSFQTEEEFLATHGDKPWDVINTVLKQFDTLDYTITSPEGFDVFNSFTLKLQHTKKSNLEIEFSSLSSGERVLMALVASIYKASSDNYFPDVLLLDELDASLHPSMIKNLLAVIRNVFLAKGLKVILVTHSPTTIALAPEESIFLMNKEGPSRLRKASRKEALSILTEGFATLDEGMMIFDEITKHSVSIVTEGHNAAVLEKVLNLQGVQGVTVLGGLEAITGKNQLRTLFDFFSRIPHKNKVIFVWDCDASSFSLLPEVNQTYPYVMPRNAANTLATSGIENAFPESLFETFKKRLIRSNGIEIVEFDESRKKDFLTFVLSRSDPGDFVHFGPFVERVRSLLS